MNIAASTKMKLKTDQKDSVKKKKTFKQVMASNWQLYVMLLIPVILVIVFCYVPMYGAQIAFKKFNLVEGIWNSPWVGIKWFTKFVNTPMFLQTVSNTLILNLYSLVMGFPFSIILALSLNYVRNNFFKKSVQMISYAPNFISVVVMAGILFQLFDTRYGVLGQILSNIFHRSIDIFILPEAFRHIYVWSGVWQCVGFSSIIYISVLSSVSPELHEAAKMDGATILQRIRHIDFPALLPTTIIQLILSTGGLLNTGFEKALLYQNAFNQKYSEVIDTYAYKIGLAASLPNQSYGAAIGLFKALICFVLLLIVNKIAQKVSDSSLW